MQTLRKSNLQILTANHKVAFMSNQDWSSNSVVNNRYVCACSAE